MNLSNLLSRDAREQNKHKPAKTGIREARDIENMTVPRKLARILSFCRSVCATPLTDSGPLRRVAIENKTTMPGLGDLLGILEIKEMRGRPRQAEAREMLEKLRDQASQKSNK